MSQDEERSAIEKMISDWLVATNQGGEAGAEGYLSFLTQDAVLLPPNAELTDDRASARELILGFTAAEDFSVTWSPTQIDVAADGNHALGIGKYEYSLKDAEGNSVSDKGKWVDAFEKQTDGTWLCSLVMWNSDLPND